MSRDIGILLAIIHMGMVSAISAVAASTPANEPEYIWLIFILIDFPVSVGYLALEALTNLDSYLWFSFLYFGVLGTVWWFYLPRLIHKLIKRLCRVS
jgi:hypothetical protein